MKNVLKNIYLVFKRILDILFALIILVILFIPLSVVAIAIKLEDGGPIFYTQDRVGKNLKPFKIYKFRSMKTGRKELKSDLTHEEMVTNVGKFIRKTSIDELPQLLNILKGEMSFIGPRPWIPEYYVWFSEEQKRRSSVLPGISGLAQIKGRNGINIFKKINYDLEYVDNISLWMDLKCIWLTVATVFTKVDAEISETGIKSEIEQLRTQKERMMREE